MILSFKYKFIFIKNYKTAGSSIENYLINYLTNKDIIAPTEDYRGINAWGSFDHQDLINNYPSNIAKKYIDNSVAFFAHMPIWLIKKRLDQLKNKFNYDFFNNFYKFSVIRNPYDVIVSDYYWQNDKRNKNRLNYTFEQIINEIKNNIYPTFRTLNLNRLMNKDYTQIECDKIIKFENLNEELSYVFDKLKIPFSGKLEIFKKKSYNKVNYKNFYNSENIKLINNIFSKEINLFKYSY